MKKFFNDHVFDTIALVVSLFAIGIAYGAYHLSEEANRISREVADRGAGKINPIIKVEYKQAYVDFESEQSLFGNHVIVEVYNKGAEPIGFVRIQVQAITAWSSERGYPIPSEYEQFDHEFREMLQPGGMVRINIKKEVLTQLQKVKPNLQSPGRFWASCGVIFSPRSVGSPSYISTGDHISFGLGWTPSLIQSVKASEYINELKLADEIFNPPVNAADAAK